MISSMPSYDYQAQPGRQPGTMPAKVRPGRLWYLVSVVVFAAGIAWLVIGFTSIVGQVNSMARVQLPGGGTVSLSHSGSYLVYFEGPGSQGGTLPSFDVHVTPASPGAAVASLTPYRTNVTYNFGSHSGRAVLTLTVTHPGSFLISTRGVPAIADGSDLAIGSNLGRGIVGTVVPSVLLIVVSAIGGLLILIIRLVRKSNMRQRQQLMS
jgi:hypothetical protein